MKKYNILIVFSRDRKQVLMCRRKKPPYQGMLNFVGGKIEAGEESRHAAYRELSEETGIGAEAISLVHVMNLSYPLEGGALCEVWTGTLRENFLVHGEENPLLWIGTDEDFSDIARFAGKGNIYHMMKYIEAYSSNIAAETDVEP